MSMRLSILLSADGKEAKREVAAIEGALGKLGKTAKSSSAASSDLKASTRSLGAATAQARRDVQLLTAEQARNAATAGQMGAANQLAAGQMGNLAAQVNDIGVMLAAGQNPLQLALQQGTQITQVIGHMGAAGAFKALGGAILSVVSPVSLLTIGTIAGGAALYQWATGAKEASAEAELLAAKIDAVKDAQIKLKEEIRTGRLGVTSEELTILDQISAKKKEIADQEAKIAAMRGLRKYDEQRPAEAARLNALQSEAAELQDQLTHLRRLQEEKARLISSTRDQSDAERLVGETMQQGAAERAKATAAAQALVAELYTEANIQSLILRHGSESRQVAEARVAAERAAFIELQNSAGVSAELKAELIAAWDAANGVASVDMAGNIALAAAEASRLVSILNRFTQFNPVTPQMQDEDALFSQPVLQNAAGREKQRRAVENFQRLTTPKIRRGGGGRRRGGGGARTQIDQAQQLTERLQDQLAVLRETDPIQKELIRNRKALAGATEVQRQTITDLITKHHEEQQALERKQELWGTVNSIASNVIDGLTDKTKSLGDVLRDTLSNLAGLVAQAAISGDGLFGGLFGGVSLGEMLFPVKKADGGMIHGPGGGRDDKVPVWASAGEFMVNARATARNRALLEAMNAGAPVQRLAAGGIVGRAGRATANANGAPGGVIHMHFDLTGARGNAEITEAVQEGIRLGLEEYDREVLPGRVLEISDNPRMVG